MDDQIQLRNSTLRMMPTADASSPSAFYVRLIPHKPLESNQIQAIP